MIMGWQIVISCEVGIKCWWGQSSIVNAALTSSVCSWPDPNRRTPSLPTPASAPCLEFKQLFCFVEMASGCLFSFLSFYFLPFFPRHLKLQRLKGMADGWSNRHSAAQWTPAASRPTAHWERRGGLWMKHWVCALWRGLKGGDMHMNINKGWGWLKMRAGLTDRTNPAFPYSSAHSYSTTLCFLNYTPAACAVKKRRMTGRRKATTY